MGVTVVKTALAASTAVTRARASVVIVAPIAETSAALLAASTSVVVAGASVTVIVPAANLNYILLASAAYLDTSGRFQYFPDEFFVTDAAFKATQKALTDTFGQTDYITNIDTDLRRHDSVSVPDFIIRTLEYIRRFTDTITPVEALSYTFARPLATTFSLTDSKSLALSRPVTSSFGSTDFARTHLTKANFETLSLADASRFSSQKFIVDGYVYTDYEIKSFEKVLADSVATSETFRKTIGRVITDGFAMNDTADLVDGVAYQTAKYITNIVFTSDTSTRAWNSTKADSVSLASSGSLTSQNYCDLSYFAQDYVGQSRTFS